MSKSQIEWITDRMPVAEDCDEFGQVLTKRGIQYFDNVNPGDWWVHTPQEPRTGEDVIRDIINHTVLMNVPPVVNKMRSSWFNQLQRYREELKKFYPRKGETK